MKSKKKISWQRWLLAGVSILFIIGMWVHKNVAVQFADMSAADALPMIAVNMAVTAVKVLLMAGAIMVIRWLAGKVKG